MTDAPGAVGTTSLYEAGGRRTSRGLNGAPVAMHYLYPGDLLATAEARVISTVLGSCVAVCLWDARTRAGGLNHFLLPHDTRESGAYRFARPAMEVLLSRMHALGSETRNLTARVLGGASQFESTSERLSIGQQNVGVATRFLDDARIPVVLSDVGGTRGRKVVFDVESGNVWVKTL